MSKFYLVTGGTGFLGSALVRRLLQEGHRVRVLDNHARGSLAGLANVKSDFEMIEGDVRDLETVQNAVTGVDGVCHLAFINGTEFFYTVPDLVLEVGVKGIMNVVDACRKRQVRELIVASSSEVYQQPPVIPTDETVPLSIPDPLNPRYSYAAGKLISEIVALNYGRAHFDRVLIFRPHNVYGPQMGWEHVVPEFILRIKTAAENQREDPIRLPIQGAGQQTRAFVFIEDFIDGLMLVLKKGEHCNIYNIGTEDEVTIESVATLIGEYFGRRIQIVPGPPAPGGTPRRCPDIRKIAAFGYAPKYSLREGLKPTTHWYIENSALAPGKSQKQNTKDNPWKIANA